MEKSAKPQNSFWVLVQKEVSDHILSWRVNIIVILLALTCLGSLYTALTGLRDAASEIGADDAFLFLKLFTISDGTLPPFFVFVSFIGPLLGIALGFDAVNSEYNKGTISRIVSQPIPRDYIINAKFTASITIISVLLFALGFLVLALGIMITGIPPTPEEFLRVICFLVLSIFYIAFWLNLSILFSIRFKQAATSALSSIAIWLFFSVFYSMMINIIAKSLHNEVLSQNLMRISPSQLYSEATMTLLTPTIRTLGPLTMEQVVGAIPSALPLSQSLLLIMSQLIGLMAATTICFGISYALFMRKEIRN
ncbi:ABC transporter permease [Lederbergia sp. NSJ-179]|nr:ABC transporter permease subunit [Lederbergia sp. NSJ-179]MCJ7841166.1 ABC transporter permease [Lederbergia sp. NSJ-179]